jgi:hypothetical protein
VTDGEIDRYKMTARNACIDSGAAANAPQDEVLAFCGCVLDTLTGSMTHPEWQQAYFYSIKERAEDEKNVLAPHMAKIEACRAKR